MPRESKLFAPRYPFDPQAIPGYYGWVIFVISLAERLISVPGHNVGIAPFTEPILQHLAITRTDFSQILGIAIFLSTFPLPTFGRVFDQIGARKAAVYSAFGLGLTLLFLGNIELMISTLTPFLGTHAATLLMLFLGFFLLKLLGQNLLPLASRFMLLRWYPHMTYAIMGVSGLFVSIIFGCGPKMTEFLIVRYGYFGAWLQMGIVTLLVILPMLWLFCRDSPESCGMAAPEGFQKKAGNTNHVTDATLWQALRTFDFWLFAIATATSTFTTTGLQIHIVDLFRDVHACMDNALNIFLPVAIVSAISGVFFGFFQERIAIYFCPVAVFAVNGLIAGSIDFIAHPWILGTFIFLFGMNWALYG
ncbi:MAG: hypothetical protein K2L24_03115, partial [Opitutales bacterium]|nr:hypothetical protein [Opitutales bacterium]